MRNFRQAIGVVLEVAGIVFLTGKGVKAEYDKHKALLELHRRECDLAFVELHNTVLKIENEHLKNQLKKNEEEKA